MSKLNSPEEGRTEKLRRSERLKFKEEQIYRPRHMNEGCVAKDVSPLIKRIMVTGRNLRKKILLGDPSKDDPNLKNERKTRNSYIGREEPKSMDNTIQKKKGRRKRMVSEKNMIMANNTSSKTPGEVEYITLEITELEDSKSTQVPVSELDIKNDNDILEVVENAENMRLENSEGNKDISSKNYPPLTYSKTPKELENIDKKNGNILKPPDEPASKIFIPVLPSFCLDREKYENVGFTQFASNPLIQTILELKKNFPFKDHICANGAYGKKDLDVKLSNDVLGLDTISLGKDNGTSDLTQLSSHIQLSGLGSDVYFDPSGMNSMKTDMLNKNADAIMKKSVLPDDLERMEKAPTFFESKNSVKLKRKKECEETAGKGWYNLPKTEITDKIKKDLQIIKMRNVLDSKHHYKRNDTNKLPKYFQVGTIVEGPHEFYSSRVPKKQRKRTMVDELLDDAEFRRKNKKKYIEICKKKMSGGKGYYKNLKNKKKETWART